MPKRSEKRDTAKAEYIAKKKKGEEVSLRALAGELGVSYQTLRNWKAADKWEEALPKKKRGGQPGNQNSKGKRNAAGSHDGAPPGNKNAEKDGAYSAVFFDMLSAEELKITESVPLGGREALEHEMKILKFREHKILAKIAEYESQPEDALFVSSLLDMRTPGGRGKDKKDGANQTMGMDLILVIVGVSLLVFTIVMIQLFKVYGTVPDTLITCVFATLGGECGIMGWIKTTKDRNRERKWEQEDKQEAKAEVAEVPPGDMPGA